MMISSPRRLAGLNFAKYTLIGRGDGLFPSLTRAERKRTMKTTAPAHKNVKTSFILTAQAQLSGRNPESHLTTADVKFV
jgi:hypothetical protein